MDEKKLPCSHCFFSICSLNGPPTVDIFQQAGWLTQLYTFCHPLSFLHGQVQVCLYIWYPNSNWRRKFRRDGTRGSLHLQEVPFTSMALKCSSCKLRKEGKIWIPMIYSFYFRSGSFSFKFRFSPWWDHTECIAVLSGSWITVVLMTLEQCYMNIFPRINTM